MSSSHLPAPEPPSPADALLRATNNFLVVWSILRDSPSAPLAPTLYDAAIAKADRLLFDAYSAITSPDLQADDTLRAQYAAVGEFFLTWSVLGPLALADWRAYLPLLDAARAKMQVAFEIPAEPTQLI